VGGATRGDAGNALLSTKIPKGIEAKPGL